MCLYNITGELANISKRNARNGYKVVWKTGREDVFQPITCDLPEFIFNKWITDSNEFEIDASSEQHYKCGFHIFSSLGEARKWCTHPWHKIAKVKFCGDKITIGTQWWDNGKLLKTYVAPTIKIVEIINL